MTIMREVGVAWPGRGRPVAVIHVSLANVRFQFESQVEPL